MESHPDHQMGLVELVESMERRLSQARAGIAEQAFSMGCSASTVPILIVTGVAYLFGARSWAGIALVLVVTVLVALTLASLLATRAQFAAGRRLYEREILPELQAYAEKNHLTLEQIGDTAVRNLPKEALLCSYLPVSPYQGFEE